jgi:hypothetical protein
MERNVCALLGREELAEMLVQIGWWHLNLLGFDLPPLGPTVFWALLLTP